MSAHLQAQLLRFARLTAAALVGEYWRTGGHLPMTWSTLWVVTPGTVETLLRQFRPVKPLPVVAAEPPGSAP